MNEEKAFEKFKNLQDEYPVYDPQFVNLARQILIRGSDTLLKKISKTLHAQTALIIISDIKLLFGIPCNRLYNLACFFAERGFLEISTMTEICCYFAERNEKYFYLFCDKFFSRINFLSIDLWKSCIKSIYYQEMVQYLLDKTSGILIKNLLDEIFPILCNKPLDETKLIIAKFIKYGYQA